MDLWIVTHPHPDHIGALIDILERPKGIEVKAILQSRFPEKLYNLERSAKHAKNCTA